MKHPVTVSFAAWCIITLLSLSSASAQKPHVPSLQGTYTLDTAASDDIEKAIEAAVEGMFFKSVARKRLRKVNVPPYQRIVISYTQTEVNITTDRRAAIKTPANGRPVNWTRENGEKFKVSTVWEGGKLKQTFQGKEGQRVNLYSLSADGKRLTMEVGVTSPKLPRPLTYKMVYQRVS